MVALQYSTVIVRVAVQEFAEPCFVQYSTVQYSTVQYSNFSCPVVSGVCVALAEGTESW